MTIDKKKNIIFYEGYDNIFNQVLLSPVLLICGAILIAFLRSKFEINFIIFIILFFIYFRTINSLKIIKKPLHIFVGYNFGNKLTSLSIGYGVHRISGILEDIIDSENFLIFKVQEKKGKNKIELPLTVLPEGLLQLFKDSILNIEKTDYILLRDKLLRFGYKAKIIEDETFSNIHAKKYPGILLIQYIALVSSLIVSYLIAFHIIV